MIKKIAILCSIFLNLCIVRWEPVAIRMTWEAVGSQTFTFYTENSNVFAFFVCLLVAMYLSVLTQRGSCRPVNRQIT